ncbi:MAG: helix-turn-helix domain-containing protein [Dechloromonas sp.]|nr:MAG: helix-turn-helix domain-containing protein [Dechloromonas sp.]
MSELDENVVAAEEPDVTAPSVGQQLAAARQARGLELADISQALKLGVRQVEALESGNWHALPGQTFIRGFVRNYARLVGVDATPLMAMLDDVLEKPAGNLVVPPSHQGAMPQVGGQGVKRDRAVVVVGALLVVLAALAYFLIPGDLSQLRDNAQGMLDSLARKEEAVAPVVPAPAEPVFPPGVSPQQVMSPQAAVPAVEESSPAPAKPAAEGAPIGVATPQVPAAPAPATSPLRLAFDKESWLEVRDRDNRLIFSQRVAAGGEQLLAGAAPLTLVIGYAPGVRLFWQGKAVDLAPHTKGDVARLVLE